MSAVATDPNTGLDPAWVLLDLLLEQVIELGYDLHGPGHQAVEARLKTCRAHRAFQLYDELGSLRKVAAALGTSEGTIRNWLDRKPAQERRGTTSVRMRLLAIVQQSSGPIAQRQVLGRYVEAYGMPRFGSLIDRSLMTLVDDGLLEVTDLGVQPTLRGREAVQAEDTSDLVELAGDATEVLLRVLSALILEGGRGQAEVRMFNLELSDVGFQTLKDEVHDFVMARGTELETVDRGRLTRPREMILGGA